jgi:hypothetical protein
MKNSKFYEFLSFQAKSYSLNDCMSIFWRSDDFEMHICDILIIYLVKNHYSNSKVAIMSKYHQEL